MKTKTQLKAGRISANHNDAQVRATKVRGLRVRTSVKAGRISANHNETIVRG
jgi:hypothetical protein